jgi:DMSO/TMAO reductase YedYZ molybdopterin-dependent catalytic subunit
MVLPGFVGGRSVKWLGRIVVSEVESDSWYHWHDNKVFPPNVDRTIASIGGWWYTCAALLLFRERPAILFVKNLLQVQVGLYAL